MNLANIAVLNTYSIILLLILGIRLYRHGEKKSRQYRLYISILIVTSVMLVFDLFSRCDGFSQSYYPLLNQVGNFVIFLMSPILPSLWLLYVHSQLHPGEALPTLHGRLIMAINGVNVFALLISQSNGWLYMIDANNVYHRGSLYFASGAINILFILLAYGMIVKNRKNVEKIVYNSLLFFAVPPIIGIVLQSIFYGTSLMLNCMVISCLIVFLNIQNRNFYTDYLNGGIQSQEAGSLFA
jgi:hypothetical protein